MPKNIEEIISEHKNGLAPVLILSSIVGRGNYSIGQAIAERLSKDVKTYHYPVENYLPARAVREDLDRYKIISNRFPFLLHAIYRISLFYFRKYLREKLFPKDDLTSLKNMIESLEIKTVICISHRPAFWVSNLKRRYSMNFNIWGVLCEFGKNLGWKYIFWEAMSVFLSPIGKNETGIDLPGHVGFKKINMPVKKGYLSLAAIKGNINNAVLACGFWGQGRMFQITKHLYDILPELNIFVICGENKRDYDKIKRTFGDNERLSVYGVVDSLEPFLKQCACIITKPGMATILEAHAAGRKIFLLKGMPVAEENNARYAIEHFGAEWFTTEGFKRWYKSAGT